LQYNVEQVSPSSEIDSKAIDWLLQ
jgi:hypothetical protein